MEVVRHRPAAFLLPGDQALVELVLETGVLAGAAAPAGFPSVAVVQQRRGVSVRLAAERVVVGPHQPLRDVVDLAVPDHVVRHGMEGARDGVGDHFHDPRVVDCLDLRHQAHPRRHDARQIVVRQ